MPGSQFTPSRSSRSGSRIVGRPPKEVTLGEIARTLDGIIVPPECVAPMAHSKCQARKDETASGKRIVVEGVRDAPADVVESTESADNIDGIVVDRRRHPKDSWMTDAVHRSTALTGFARRPRLVRLHNMLFINDLSYLTEC